MRRRFQKYLPIVLVALMVQIFAPIGACWAAAVVASDPLAAEWGKVRNQPQLSGCLDVSDGGSCSAF